MSLKPDQAPPPDGVVENFQLIRKNIRDANSQPTGKVQFYLATPPYYQLLADNVDVTKAGSLEEFLAGHTINVQSQGPDEAGDQESAGQQSSNVAPKAAP